ncbi:MAG TPA: hypothetical protein VN802_02855 [Stellaceae bacterium]|nr:hypothetical protein [Stellaceae bacterium]
MAQRKFPHPERSRRTHGRNPAIAYAALIVLALAAQPASASDDDLTKAATGFYAAYMRLHPMGVPGAKARARLHPLVSTSLYDLLAAADKAEARHARRTKGSEPPIVEGDLFTSLFEGAKSYSIRSCARAERSATCDVDLKYVDPRDKAATAWSDTVILVESGGRWLVDDIEYGGAWDFARKGRLKDELKAALDEAK